MKRQTGSPSLSREGTDYRPAVRLTGMLEKDGRGAVVERSQARGAGRQNEWKSAKLSVEEEPEQQSEEKDGRRNLLPEMDRAELFRAWPGLGASLLCTRDRGRTGM